MNPGLQATSISIQRGLSVSIEEEALEKLVVTVVGVALGDLLMFLGSELTGITTK